jgi:hypothetical protein
MLQAHYLYCLSGPTTITYCYCHCLYIHIFWGMIPTVQVVCHYSKPTPCPHLKLIKSYQPVLRTPPYTAPHDTLFVKCSQCQKAREGWLGGGGGEGRGGR